MICPGDIPPAPERVPYVNVSRGLPEGEDELALLVGRAYIRQARAFRTYPVALTADSTDEEMLLARIEREAAYDAWLKARDLV